MTRVKLTAGLHLWWHNCEYLIQHRVAHKLQLLNPATGQTSWIEEKELIQAFFAQELTLKNPVEFPTLQSYQSADYTQIPDALKAEAHRKQKYITAVLAQNLETYTRASLSPIIEQVALIVEDAHPPLPLTLYRWLKDYHHSGGDIRSLIPRHRAKGNYQPKIAPEVHQLISEVVSEVYLTPSRPSIARIYDVIICRLQRENIWRKSLGQTPLKIPHRSTIYRQIHKLDPIEKVIGRYGHRTANLIYKELTKFFQPSPSIVGISVLGNAYNREPNLSDTYQIDLEVTKPEEISQIVATDRSSFPKLSPKSRKKHSPKSMNLEQLTPVSSESESVDNTDEWQPDLTGWGVSINLPT